MSLPLKALDRLFEKLILTYGRQFMAQWDILPDSELPRVKEEWGNELAIYGERLDAIAWALENLPPRPPNIIEFKALCRSAPRPPEQALPASKADPERVRAELAKLGHLREQPITGNRGIEWAQAIRRRHRMGERVNLTALKFAEQALASRGLAE